jgi:peptidoglycan/LPS O-acetylase OafA/YrhL
MRSPRFHALDVWRGAVCLLVVLEHAAVALWPVVGDGVGLDGRLRRWIVGSLGLFLGTPLFFVMSGYCIASCIDSVRRRGASPVLFLARRVWRIFPPYWFALAGFVAVVAGLDALGLERYHRNGVALALDSPAVLDAWQWFGNLSLTETWRPMLGGHEASVYTRVAWSLCYQEQFYLVCFLTLLVARGRFERVLVWATAAIVGFRLLAYDAGAQHRIAGTFPMYWHEFFVGLVVYWRLSRPTTPVARRGMELGLAALLIVALRNGLVSTAAAAGFGLLLIALHRWDGRIADLRWLDPLRACGRLSYSLYLVHLPVVMVFNSWLWDLGMEGFWPRALVMVPASSLASVAAAWVFHRVVERHFLDLPDVRLALTGLLQAARTPRRLPTYADLRMVLALNGKGREAGLVLRPLAVRVLTLAVFLSVPVGLEAARGSQPAGRHDRPLAPRPRGYVHQGHFDRDPSRHKVPPRLLIARSLRPRTGPMGRGPRGRRFAARGV